MANLLPPVGTTRLLELVSPYVPDDFILNLCPRLSTGGRRCALSAPQLWRLHLLVLLTSTHSLNLVVTQLPEQAAWRRFCRLRRHWPGVRMLHEFRQQVGVSGLRRFDPRTDLLQQAPGWSAGQRQQTKQSFVRCD